MSRPPRIVEAAEAMGGAKALHDSLTPAQREAIRYDWSWWLRPLEQIGPREFRGQGEPPGDWSTWLAMTGAGWGKTKVGGQWVIDRAIRFPKCRIAIVGSTAKDAREVMWEGESGIYASCPPWWRPTFNVTDQAIEFPNGSLGFLYTAEVPDALRGPQHHFAWGDEIAKWRRLQDAYDLLSMRLRLGIHPQALFTTTPKRLPFLRKLAARETTVVTRGRTVENAANLPKSWLAEMLSQYGGTTLGRQELEGALLDDVDGALWQSTWIDASRMIPPEGKSPREILDWLAKEIGEPLRRIVVAVDPATTSKESSDECGIVVVGVGRSPKHDDTRDHAYILEDATARISPDKWARKVALLYAMWGADCVVAETTMGGETIPSLIRFVDDTINVIEKGGNRGKRTRAEPIAALYESGRCHHCGSFTVLEDQMCSYTLDTPKSPNNMDAMVHGVGELILRNGFSWD